ncbi:MAG: hypothetical protein UV60_C0011G0002 [Parcubacteria group bacterium GW2011_GWA2_43_11]|nr:MAG: hypothetical protein UU89_C0046G0002 [Parcubacteria group bacterium GW2011_GWC2_42_11]KKS85102.1 MAG: hypothetical protein UV60_C0011G0002 [Parcubacteria group bacterium GW2011_GWA2_43_11]
MTSILRTKQQIACDGVRTTWYADAFTEILHQQVTTQFSMDGVVPSKNVAHASIHKGAIASVPQAVAVEGLQQTQEKLKKFAGNIDGVRFPLGVGV